MILNILAALVSVAIFGRLRPNWSFQTSIGREISSLVAGRFLVAWKSYVWSSLVKILISRLLYSALFDKKTGY